MNLSHYFPHFPSTSNYIVNEYTPTPIYIVKINKPTYSERNHSWIFHFAFSIVKKKLPVRYKRNNWTNSKKTPFIIVLYLMHLLNIIQADAWAAHNIIFKFWLKTFIFPFHIVYFSISHTAVKSIVFMGMLATLHGFYTPTLHHIYLWHHVIYCRNYFLSIERGVNEACVMCLLVREWPTTA